MAEPSSSKRQRTDATPCKQCKKLASIPSEPNDARIEAGVLWEDALWLVMHKRPPCGVVGHLLCVSKSTRLCRRLPTS